MILAELLDGLVVDRPLTKNVTDIKGIALDSRKVKKDFVFIAVTGAIEHGLVHASKAIEQGACIIVYDPKGSEHYAVEHLDCDVFAVEDLSLKLGCIADRFYNSPSKEIEVIGVTGTNGKTSCSQFLAQLIPECGVIGTLGWGEQGALNETINTTPDALDVQQILAGFLVLKKKTVVMEVSSHGMEQGRVNAVNFKGAVFTNFTRDHLDYHGSMAAYLTAKLALFKRPELQFAVVNMDDDHALRFLGETHKQVKRWAFSTKGCRCESAENVIAEGAEYSLEGLKFFVCWQNQKVWVQTKIVGDFNLENILAVITVLLAQGYPLEFALKKVAELLPVEGRMERFGGDTKPVVFVDYAHTADALEKVLQGLRKYCSQTVWLIFGCGGNRDKGKRAQMGAVAEKLSDKVIITDDNPRLEDSKQIIRDILMGFNEKNYEVIQNREEAIQSVINRAEKQDCIVVAGKGHENYQDIQGLKHAFSDRYVVQQALSERAE